MPSALPKLRNTSGTLNAQVLYPLVRTVFCQTFVAQFQSAAEQRWAGQVPLYGFALPFTSLNSTDKAAWLTFFNTVLGKFGADLQITLGSTVYGNLTLQTDELVAVNSIPLFFNQQVTLRQVSNYPFTFPTVGGTYPNLLFGSSGTAIVSCELPFSQSNMAQTDVNDSPYGQHYAYPWFKNGTLTGFPNVLLKAWRISYPLLTDADALTLENYFTAKRGRYKLFDFVDPLDGSTNHNVRFDSDTLAFKYITKNAQSTEITLRQVWV